MRRVTPRSHTHIVVSRCHHVALGPCDIVAPRQKHRHTRKTTCATDDVWPGWYWKNMEEHWEIGRHHVHCDFNWSHYIRAMLWWWTISWLKLMPFVCMIFFPGKHSTRFTAHRLMRAREQMWMRSSASFSKVFPAGVRQHSEHMQIQEIRGNAVWFCKQTLWPEPAEISLFLLRACFCSALCRRHQSCRPWN